MIPDEHVFDEHVFTHPVFDQAAIAAQSRVEAMQGRRNVWFCGAYLGHGFHEDGHVSGILAANGLNAATGHPIHVVRPQTSHRPTVPSADTDRPIVAEPVLAFHGSE